MARRTVKGEAPRWFPRVGDIFGFSHHDEDRYRVLSVDDKGCIARFVGTLGTAKGVVYEGDEHTIHVIPFLAKRPPAKPRSRDGRRKGR